MIQQDEMVSIKHSSGYKKMIIKELEKMEKKSSGLLLKG